MQPQTLAQGLRCILLRSRVTVRDEVGLQVSSKGWILISCILVSRHRASLLVSVMSQYCVVHQTLLLPVLAFAKVSSCLVTLALYLCVRNRNHCSLQDSI